jgi:hypothetical protein
MMLAARAAEMRRLVPNADGATIDELTVSWVWSAGLTTSIDEVSQDVIDAFLALHGIGAGSEITKP